MIFIGGIHGVGKSFICNKLKSKFNLMHFSSSNLISQKKKEQFGKSKKIKNINQNQTFLQEAIDEIKYENYFLDGHFCLLNKEGKITKIDEKTFIDLSPKAIIVLTNSTKTIAERLKCRDNISYDIDLLESLQSTEIEYSEYIAKKLEIPYFFYNPMSSTEDELSHFIKQLLD
ncbi:MULTISPECIES: ATP-binding protein [Bacillus]|uniref:ATP-binding protein n=1 Tax=Bacillus TaxID=1386 RepID=UPI001CDBE76E|nr:MULTISPECIES: ATP-binding protein [Bacillus]MCY7764904.1 ATP-binding protein [Bacillus inaquosorum]MCY8072090.1 ATP-binding protein [Bacillus inaquosorum]MCY9101321.1 ATP-binding protein [Bacillus inaquosorum]MCY9377572.1 ATP-binding protein [Bacillus inaquosorum]